MKYKIHNTMNLWKKVFRCFKNACKSINNNAFKEFYLKKKSQIRYDYFSGGYHMQAFRIISK